MIPVYMINGFLDSGKTEFIQYTIAQPYFQMRAKTLLIVCEEGDIEYDATLLKKSRTVMELIEDEEDFTAQNLIELEKKHKPARILIEFNGMWNSKNVKRHGTGSWNSSYLYRRLYIFHLFYEYEISAGRTYPQVRADHHEPL